MELSMLSVAASYEKLIQSFYEWAEKRPDIKAACIIGSRARTDHPADEWADLDLVVVTTNPEYYLSKMSWIDELGKPLLTFLETTPASDTRERRVLFEGMLDVDFNILRQELAAELLTPGAQQVSTKLLVDVFGRGMRILIDRDQMLTKLRTFVSSIVKQLPLKPTEEEFLGVINDFLYHAVFSAKHLRRGELWWTVQCLDCYLQELMKTMIEWHALATSEWKRDVWFRGRFLEEWANPEDTRALSKALAHYDKEDVKQSLTASMALFSRIAKETARILSFSYPVAADKEIADWIKVILSVK
jgi:aminoglycoside 6-adenylyltransferase